MTPINSSYSLQVSIREWLYYSAPHMGETNNHHSNYLELQRSPSYRAFMESPFRSIKHSTYFFVYDELFSKYRNQEFTFIEIGVLGGGSLFMWRNFFGEKARIIGIDLNPEAKRWESHGFEIIIGNQADPNFWDEFTKKVSGIDVVLDDGGHTYSQQILTSEKLLDHLNDEGLIVIEDAHTSYLRGFGNKNFSAIKYAKRMIDKINYRFAEISAEPIERRVWSIRFFESFIVFQKKKIATELNSFPAINNGQDAQVDDFRHNENQTLAFFNVFFPRLLRRLPGGQKVTSYIQQLLANLGVRASRMRKYF